MPRGNKPANLSGQRFHRLTANQIAKDKPSDGKVYWECICDCGEVVIVRAESLKSGNTKSCGCLHKDTVGKLKTTHGLSDTTEYFIWQGMWARCTNPNHKSYNNYGGRGITVCERWRLFENFLEDMGLRPGPEYSLDRKENDKGYCKENCRWATGTEQANNRRKPKPRA